MKRTLILATVLTAAVSGAGLALANSPGEKDSSASEAQMFLTAKVSLDQASQIALKELPGKLAAIGFEDENGRGVYEATVIGADGKPSIVKIDAETGAVLGKGLASVMDNDDNGGGKYVGDAEHSDRGKHGQPGEEDND